MPSLYFARHGQSEANILREFSNRGRRHSLTALGREQAAILAAHLQGERVVKIYSSPLLRATETADILAAAWDVPVDVTDALCEFDCGILEGTSEAAGWTLQEEVMAAWLAGDYERRIEGGESFLDMRARFVPFVEGVVATADPTAGALVYISHGGLYHHMLPLVLQNIDAHFAATHVLGNCGYVLAETHPDGLYAVEWSGLAVRQD
jgi:2,3-bisphosphoglycerate-dependent phosphoglycerate mutase